jgi:hypothetical protein
MFFIVFIIFSVIIIKLSLSLSSLLSLSLSSLLSLSLSSLLSLLIIIKKINVFYENLLNNELPHNL